MNLLSLRRRALCMAAAMLLGLLATGCGPAAEVGRTAERPPNIVFILIDDLGWSDLPAYGNPFHETPNLDGLVADGMRFTDAYAAAPVCSPTRASIQTGRYPARVGVTSHIPGHLRPFEKLADPVNRTPYLPRDEVTVAEVLRERGYATGYFGKWHLGEYDPAYTPDQQGYDEMLVSRGGHFRMQDRLIPKPEDVEPDDYLAEILTDRSLAFLEENQDQPFFLFLSHFAVHIPLHAREALIEKYENKEKPDTGVNHPVYAAMIEHVDRSVGRILDKLEELELAENTLVVFYSDNGGLRERFDRADGVVVTTNAPLRDEKGTTYEGGIRVPLIVRWPGVVEPGSVSEEIVSSVDFLPTLADAAETEAPQDRPIDGRSIVPALTQAREDTSRTIYWHYPHYHHGVPSGAIRQGPYKLIEFFDDGHVELFNLEEDIGEQNNLAGEMPEKARALQQDLAAWRESVGADMPVENPGFDPERRYEWGTHPHRELVVQQRGTR